MERMISVKHLVAIKQQEESFKTVLQINKMVVYDVLNMRFRNNLHVVSSGGKTIDAFEVPAITSFIKDNNARFIKGALLGILKRSDGRLNLSVCDIVHNGINDSEELKTLNKDKTFYVEEF